MAARGMKTHMRMQKITELLISLHICGWKDVPMTIGVCDEVERRLLSFGIASVLQVTGTLNLECLKCQQDLKIV